MEPVRSTASILAILSAIGSFFLSVNQHPFWGLIAGFVAILFGLLGFLRSVSPRISGGMISLSSVVLGAAAMLFALIRAII